MLAHARLMVMTATLVLVSSPLASASPTASTPPPPTPSSRVRLEGVQLASMNLRCRASACSHLREARFSIDTYRAVEVELVSLAWRAAGHPWRPLRTRRVEWPNGTASAMPFLARLAAQTHSSVQVHHDAAPVPPGLRVEYRVHLRIDGREVSVLALRDPAAPDSSEVVSGCW